MIASPRRSPNRVGLGLTPAGSGVLTLFFPGIVVAVVSGHRILIAVSLGSGALLLLAAVVSLVAVRRVDVAARTPPVAHVGTPVDVEIALTGSRGMRCLVGFGAGAPGRADSAAVVPAHVTVTWAPRNREVIKRAIVTLTTAGPFGLVASLRSVAVDLDHPLPVGPAAVALAVPSSLLDRVAGCRAETGPPEGVRRYRAGDRQRDVHWPTVARTGALMVRDRSLGTADGELIELAVLVDAPDTNTAEHVFGVARTLIEWLVGHGVAVRLTTMEPDGPKTAWVRTRSQSTTRLARAVPGGGPCPAASGSAVHVGVDGIDWR